MRFANGLSSTPAKGGRDLGKDRLDDVRIVVDTELIGHGQEQRVGFRDGLVRRQLLYQSIRLGGVAATEDRPRLFIDEADRVLALVAAAEIGAVEVVHQRKNAAADRYTWLTRVTC